MPGTRPTSIEPRPSTLLNRRTVLGGAAGGLLLGALSTGGVAQAATSPIPKLPYEVSRSAVRVTKLGKKQYEAIDVVLGTDRVRIFVPYASLPGTKKAVGVLWFFHANGSDYTSIDGAYKYGAEMAVDQGAVCVCANYGGSLWTTQPAIQAQVNVAKYMSTVWKIGLSFMRGNSGGGSLMCYSYGKKLVPAARGMYMANATYDMEDLFDRDPVRIAPVYGNNRALAIATNPARFDQSAWKGTRVKTVVSLLDPLVTPSKHGLALADKARPVATEVIVQYHDQGHVVPGWTQTDMIKTFQSWM
ncbi:hypothetical protein WJX64_13800 [Leifsonia sp. YIM 134122]|uniref:Alpha/beta hydrolase n=1 Tax=Leifsonia stereocauli TaxID=3134136 RepID=A0ABU9W6K0_9MICO